MQQIIALSICNYSNYSLSTSYALSAYEVDRLSTSYADNAKTVGNLKVMYFIEGAVTQLICHQKLTRNICNAIQ